jgi:hypothetical protein
MQITIVNRSTSPVPGPGVTSVPAGGELTLAGRTAAELASLVASYVSDLVQVHMTLEDADLPPLKAIQKTPADPGSGVGTIAAVGFDIEDVYGNAFSTVMGMYLGVFQDADCTIPATDATLDTAATGTIVAGAGTNLLEITPAGGVVSVTLTDAVDEVVYVKAWVVDSARAVETSSQYTATFIP